MNIISAKYIMNAVKTFSGALLLLMTIANGAYAATIEVRQSGCDNLPNCYITIGDAITHAQTGDTVQVYPGLYEEAVVIDKNLSLFGSGCQQTRIFSAIVNGVTINPYITTEIRGFSITGASNGIWANQSTSVIVRNDCIVNSGNGINVATLWGTNLLADNNVIGLNAGFGIICTNCNQSTISAHNNVIFNNGTGTYVSCISCGTNVSNNDFYGNTVNFAGRPLSSPSDISVDCQFIGSSSGNFVLQSSSPCKNVGIDGLAYADPDGSRNDLGAYGGPYAAAFWPYNPGTPTITEITLTPPSVQKGMPITIDATAVAQ